MDSQINGDAWYKSSYSHPYSDCVEVRTLPEGGRVAVRDSKNPSGTALTFSPAGWSAFILGARDGGFAG
jgi:hypothetical protein